MPESKSLQCRIEIPSQTSSSRAILQELGFFLLGVQCFTLENLLSSHYSLQGS